MIEGMGGVWPRYVLKPDPHSSHSIILRWLGNGRERRLLDVGAADGLLSRQLTAGGWRVTAIEGDPALARAGARHCDRMITANLARGIPDHSHLRFFTERSLRAMVGDAGLDITRFTATPAPLYQILPESWHKPWVAATHAINARIARNARRLLGYQFIVLARPKGAS